MAQAASLLLGATALACRPRCLPAMGDIPSCTAVEAQEMASEELQVQEPLLQAAKPALPHLLRRQQRQQRQQRPHLIARQHAWSAAVRDRTRCRMDSQVAAWEAVERSHADSKGKAFNH
mmetsp:Transcript_41520/g.128665  ORF Transcript_41520/g.128665 Transcript_41520/m.128665 type:complete len:119 (-) Transcript_41520:122-478(-)